MAQNGKPESTPHASAAARSWWKLSIEELVSELATDLDRGLDESEVARRLIQYGTNELVAESPVPFWRKVASHVNELFVWMLLIAAAISAIIGDWIDMAAILAIVVLNVAIGLFQEERAGRALAALRGMLSPIVRATRDGSLKPVDARGLVPGDQLQLEAGDNIPADVRLVKTFGFRTQEAALTGESIPVEKAARCIVDDEAQVSDRTNMAFMGTTVAAGRATAIVVATGMGTELGAIAGMLQHQETELTPLQRQLAGLGRALLVVCLLVVAIVFALHLYRGGEFLEVLLLSISLAVASVPEGLPAIVTITLAAGLQRMAKRNALVRHLPSVETLGAVTVICSDKTGTLTRNEMTVREIVVGEKTYSVTGTGYSPFGQFIPKAAATLQDEAVDSFVAADPAVDENLHQVLAIGAICNNASLTSPAEPGDSWSVVGDPTEGALLVAARKGGIDLATCDVKRLHEIPFDSDRKSMSVIVRKSNSKAALYAKGAPEILLAKCSSEQRGCNVEPLSETRREVIKAAGSGMAARALRVLALAYRELPIGGTSDDFEKDLTFAGLVGMMDPPRDGVLEAVQRCRAAGIRPVIVTGDHPQTSLAIGYEVGIVAVDSQLVTGAGLDELTEQELDRQLPLTSIYARVSANHKLRVVRAWQRNNAIVAVTGDGVNDAPAVKSADIGIAMGITGSDVTKETADMVLTDDNFASIVNAVEEGRGIFDNIQKFVHYLLSCNASEVFLMLIAGLAGWPPPLSALQILWINLVTDGLPALALGLEPPERDVMRRAPRTRSAPIIDWKRGFQMLRHGMLMSATSAAAFWWIYRGENERLLVAQSSVFAIVAFSQLLYSLSCRSHRYTMPEIGTFTNPYLFGAIVASGLIQLLILALPATQTLFDLDGRLFSEWQVILVAALIPVSAIEIAKLLCRPYRIAHAA